MAEVDSRIDREVGALVFPGPRSAGSDLGERRYVCEKGGGEDERGVVVQIAGERIRVQMEDERERAAHAVTGTKESGRREVRAVMPGVVAEIMVAVGDEVEEGSTLVILEAMKMQNPLQAEGSGTVIGLHVQKGESVASGQLLLELG